MQLPGIVDGTKSKFYELTSRTDGRKLLRARLRQPKLEIVEDIPTMMSSRPIMHAAPSTVKRSNAPVCPAAAQQVVSAVASETPFKKCLSKADLELLAMM